MTIWVECPGPYGSDRTCAVCGFDMYTSTLGQTHSRALATGIVAAESEIADLRKRIRDTESERDEWKRRALPTPLTPERDQDVRGWIARMWDQNAEGRGYARDLLGLVEYGAKQLADARTELSEWQKRAAQAQAVSRALLDADIDRGEREARVEQALAAYAGVKEERDRAVANAQVLELALKNRRRAALKEAAEVCRGGTWTGGPGSSFRLDCAEEIDALADEPAPEVE